MRRRMPRGRSSLAIGVMAKAPVAGFAKTRLIPLLGEIGAAKLQASLIEQTLETCRAAAPGGVSLFITGEGGEPYWAECRRAYGAALVEQRGQTLGERMDHATGVLLGCAPRALLVGTDCPGLRVHHLHAAAAALRGRSLVFIPATDGGYVLVGATGRYPSAFPDIAWGTSTVMEETRQALRSLGWRCGHEWAELDAMSDLDEPADYLAALRAGWVQPITPMDRLPDVSGVAR